MTKLATCFFLLAIIIVGLGCVSGARTLFDDDAAATLGTETTYENDTSSSAGAVTTGEDSSLDDVADTPLPDVTAPVASPVDIASSSAVATGEDSSVDDDVADPPLPDVTAPVASPVDITGADVSPTVGQQPQLTFFMHDIVGGSHPSVRTVTGVITATDLSAVPFSKPANNIFPLTGGVPLLNGNGGNSNLNQLLNNNNLPYLTGLNPGGAKPTTIIQTNGNNNQVNGGNNQPFVTAGQLPFGSTIQNLMFGSITVIDDEVTEGHELGSSVVGKAQGFYLASSLDGTSHTMALTLMFHDVEKEIVDTISLFGVHRTVSVDSQVAIVGGTGKYEHAKGYATVVTLQQVDQHTTDGVDSIFEFNVYFSDE